MDSLKISVVIPTYKTEKESIERCLKSILNQSYSHYEIIIIDDGNSSEYRESVYSSDLFKDERIQLIFQENQGVSAARNKGIEIADGDYITFIDADDVVFSDFFYDAAEIAVSHHTDVIIGGIIRSSDIDYTEKYDKLNVSTTWFDEKDRDLFKTLFVGRLMKFKENGSYVGRGPVAKIIKTKLAKSVSFDSTLSIYEDTVWNLDLCDQVRTICVVSQPWYGYICNDQSASQGFHQNELKRSSDGMAEIKKRMDFSSVTQKRAFLEQCILEYGRIVNNYFLNDSNTESIQSKNRESKLFIQSSPWNFICEWRKVGHELRSVRLSALLISANLWLSCKMMQNKIRMITGKN